MFRRLAEVDTLSRSFVALSLEKSYAGATVADNGKNLFSDRGGCRTYHTLRNPPLLIAPLTFVSSWFLDLVILCTDLNV